MARQALKGLEYTYLNVAFFQDRKIRRLQRRCGESAPLVYIAVLCAIYAEGYYIQWDDDVALDLADTTRMEEEYISKVIDECMEVGLLSKEMFELHHILTSSGIQKQYQFICEKSKRKSTISEYSLLIPSETMPIHSEGIDKNAEEMQYSIVYNSIEENNIPDNSIEDSFSSSSSPSSEVDPSEDEKQEEKFLSYMFFLDWAAPNKEYQKFVAFNNTGGRCWAKMNRTQRESALVLWKQEPEQPKRFGETYLRFWKMVYDLMVSLNAPHSVLMHALSDNVRFVERAGRATIVCTADVRDYIEKNLDAGFRAIIQRLLFQPRGISNLSYQVCPT